MQAWQCYFCSQKCREVLGLVQKAWDCCAHSPRIGLPSFLCGTISHSSPKMIPLPLLQNNISWSECFWTASGVGTWNLVTCVGSASDTSRREAQQHFARRQSGSQGRRLRYLQRVSGVAHLHFNTPCRNCLELRSTNHIKFHSLLSWQRRVMTSHSSKWEPTLFAQMSNARLSW
jgi:hypothetical protein